MRMGVAELVKTDPRELRDFALQFGELVRALPFQLPENFLLLGRTISIVSGVTSSLNRDFNMWDALDPFARTLLQGGEVAVRNPQLESRLCKLERTQNGQALALYFAALFGGGIYLDQQGNPFGSLLLAASAVPVLVALIARRLP
jgi:hypothetical protein